MKPAALSIIGWSGAGKTTLIRRLVPALRQRGLRVGVVKHSSHAHALHPEGRDTAAYAEVGAALVGLATPEGVQLSLPEPLDAGLSLLQPFADRVELVLVEGWKDGPLPKLEVWREGLGPLLAASRPEVLAVVSAGPLPEGTRRFPPEDVEGLARFIHQRLNEGWRSP